MTEGRYNPTRLPAGLDEADLLALVEGEPLASAKAAAAERALGADPALARLVAAMRRDREGLRGLGEARAPAGLMEAVGASLQTVLERQMLLGISDGTPVDDRPPVSLVMPARRSWLSGSTGRRLALAAGVLLVVSGGVFTAATLMSQGAPKSALGPMARNNPAEAPAFREPASPDRTLALKDSTAATAPDEAAAEKAHEEERGVTAAAPTATAADPGVTALAEADPEAVGPPVPGPMEASEAVRLAAENRLVVRIVTSDGRIDRITSRLAKPGYAAGWQLTGEAPIALASLLGPEAEPTGAPRQLEPPSFAGNGDFAKLAPPMGPPAPAMDWKPEPSVYVLQARMDEPTLEGLRKAMREAGAEVVFEESENALPMDHGPVTAPGAIVWWGAGGWSAWGSVPVVIQR